MAIANQPQTVDFKHPGYCENIVRWMLVDDICDARNLDSYLIKMNPTDRSTENAARNKQLFERAIFYAIAGYTSRGLVGKVFAKDPELIVPESLDYVSTNIDGAGISIVQQSQDALKEVIRKGRAGLFIDMVSTQKELSKSDLAFNFSTVSLFAASEIINWKTKQIGSQAVLSQVVLATTEDIPGPDGFSFTAVQVRLELRLDEIAGENGTTSHVYSVVEWRANINNKNLWAKVGSITPTNGAGQTLDRIPFVFLGSESNTIQIDAAPMYDIAVVNKGHYNNSAIYEDAVFIVGQPQPWMSGITEDLVALWKTSNMYIGSGRLFGVPSGEQFGIAQVQPDCLAKEAMNDKVDMMIGLGAMIIQPGGVAKTATESAGELLSQHSVLSLIAANISEGYTDALQFQAAFMNVDNLPDDMGYTLNQDFIDPAADFNMLREIVAAFMSGAIPIKDYHEWLKQNRLRNPESKLEDFVAEMGNALNNLDLDDDEA